MGHNLSLPFGVDEHPFATYFDVHQGFPGFDPQPLWEHPRSSHLPGNPAKCRRARPPRRLGSEKPRAKSKRTRKLPKKRTLDVSKEAFGNEGHPINWVSQKIRVSPQKNGVPKNESHPGIPLKRTHPLWCITPCERWWARPARLLTAPALSLMAPLSLCSRKVGFFLGFRPPKWWFSFWCQFITAKKRVPTQHQKKDTPMWKLDIWKLTRKWNDGRTPFWRPSRGETTTLQKPPPIKGPQAERRPLRARNLWDQCPRRFLGLPTQELQGEPYHLGPDGPSALRGLGSILKPCKVWVCLILGDTFLGLWELA